jgi:hypothetical protein
MLESLMQHGKASDRKLRLFACACCRRIWELLPSEASRRLVAAVEDHPNGSCDNPDLKAAIITASRRERQFSADPGYWAVKCLGRSYYKWDTVTATQCAMLRAAVRKGDDSHAERAAQAVLFRDIFGNPFRPWVPFHPSWRTPAVLSLAQEAYDDRSFDYLPELARLLQVGGCEDTELLDHLRGPGPHLRGCWALDAVLGLK